MSSLFGTANKTGVTILDTLASTATMVSDAVSIASRGLDMLAVQTENMHKRVTTESGYALIRDMDDLENRYATEILEQRDRTQARLAKLNIDDKAYNDVVNMLKAGRRPQLSVAAE